MVHMQRSDITKHWLIICIVLLGAFLRTWKLDTHAILFSDAGRDLLAAQEAVKSGTIPLLGIPSSVPRFHQGPLTIWLHMVVYLIWGNTTLAYSLVFAFLSILALIFTYEFAVLHLNKPTAWAAATLLAVSPLAIAHARVPYHITPIPLVLLIFLFAQMRLWEQKKLAPWIAFLSWCLLMQFELAMFGLVLIPLCILWKKKYPFTKDLVGQISAAGLIGFLPQIIHDLSHPIQESQLGTFFAWVGYRVVSLSGLTGEHQFTVHKFITALQAFGTYGQRIFSTDNLIVSMVVVIALITTAWTVFKKVRARIASPGSIIASLTLLILSLSYVVHGGPSEAYFPPYTVLLSLLIGYGLTEVFKHNTQSLVGLLSIYVVVNVLGMFNHNFFVSTANAFNYGPSVQEQREIIRTIVRLSNNAYTLQTTDPGGKFSSYFNNYQWLAQEMGAAESPGGQVFFIELKGSPLNGYPNSTKIEFASRDVFFY